jgi:hypothetical protein
MTQVLRESCGRCGAALTAVATPARPVVRDAVSRGTNPFRTFWGDPRGTVREIVNSDPTRHVILLAWLYGVLDLTQGMVLKASGQDGWAPFFVGMTLCMGPLAGFAVIFLKGSFLAMTGGWLGGDADPTQVRAAFAWGSLPELLSLPVWMVAVVLVGPQLFETHARAAASATVYGVLGMFGFLQFALWIWAFVTRLQCVAEVHSISVHRAFWALFLAWLVPLTAFVGMVLVFAPDVPPKHGSP